MDIKLVIQIILSLVLISLIVIQANDAGLGRTWGGSSLHYGSKKGLEKVLFTSTIVTSILFVLMAIINNLF